MSRESPCRSRALSSARRTVIDTRPD
jgi:hypothetical protein